MTNLLERISRAKSGSKAVKHFAEEHGLVYFGHVDQIEDALTMIRGVTVSTQHHDRHYCVGSFGDYDVSYVMRTDRLAASATKKPQPHTWQVMAFDLHTNHEVPHIFMGLHSHSDVFYQQLFVKHGHLRLLPLNTIATHSGEFRHRYRPYGRPVDALQIEAILPPQLDSMLLAHFQGLAFEVLDNTLYLYSERSQPTFGLLEAMIKNGTWLAGHIDAVMKQA